MSEPAAPPSSEPTPATAAPILSTAAPASEDPDVRLEQEQELIDLSERVRGVTFDEEDNENGAPYDWSAEFDKLEQQSVELSSALFQRAKQEAAEKFEIEQLETVDAKDEDGWRAALLKLMPEHVMEALRQKDFRGVGTATSKKTKRSKSAHDMEPLKYEHLFAHVRHAQTMQLGGSRFSEWVDPHYDQQFRPRVLEEVSPVGMGYDCAVILAKHKQDCYLFYVARFGVTPHVAINETIARAYNAESERWNRAMAERHTYRLAYEPTMAFPFEKPVTTDVHGTHVSAVHVEKGGPMRLLFHKLPLCMPEKLLDFPFPALSLVSYDLYYPYLCLHAARRRSRTCTG
jgi:hypothetical protein